MRFNRLRVGHALRNSRIGREPSASQDGHILRIWVSETGFSPDSQFPTIPFHRTYFAINALFGGSSRDKRSDCIRKVGLLSFHKRSFTLMIPKV